MNIVICTNNQNKVAQYGVLFPEATIYTQADIVGKVEVKEVGHTFQDNAVIKFEEFLKAYEESGQVLEEGTLVYAEDSGLVITNLVHPKRELRKYQFPGVYSKSWLEGASADRDGDIKRNNQIIEMAKDLTVEERTAYFLTCAAFGVVDENNNIEMHMYEYDIEGTLPEKPTAADMSWFGFDSIFVPKGEKKTLAQMTLEQRTKNNPRPYVAKYMTDYMEKSKC